MTDETYGAGSGIPVVLDTDIGSDVDDLLALVVLADEPRVDLVAVTTVYGDTILRARLTRRVLRLAGRGDVPVHAGMQVPHSGRHVWWAGHEGRGVEGLENEVIGSTDAIDTLRDAADRHPGELVVIAIGPLSNVAEALDRDPSWARRVRRLVVMGGEFTGRVPEHNIRCDVVAAQKVLASGIPSTYVGLDVTTTVQFDEADLDAVTGSQTALATLVRAEVRQFWRLAGQTMNNPHDPLAVLAMLEPDWFSLEQSGWRVTERGEHAGQLTRASDMPAIQYATSVDAHAVRASLQRRLSAAITKGERPGRVTQANSACPGTSPGTGGP